MYNWAHLFKKKKNREEDEAAHIMISCSNLYLYNINPMPTQMANFAINQ